MVVWRLPVRVFALSLLVFMTFPAPASAQDGAVLFRGVRVFDGVGPALSAPTNVRVRGNIIEAIGPAAAADDARIVEGRGRTLMPGLIDVHVHMTFSALSMPQLLSPDLTPATAEAGVRSGAPKPCCCAGSPACAMPAAPSGA